MEPFSCGRDIKCHDRNRGHREAERRLGETNVLQTIIKKLEQS